MLKAKRQINEFINLDYNSYLRIILSTSIFFMVAYFGLVKGGRWDLNEQIITGFNIINGNLDIYQPGLEGKYAVTTIYPYFQPLILGIFSKLTSLRNLEFLTIILICPICVVTLFNFFIDLSFKAYSKKNYTDIPKSLHMLQIASIFYLSRSYIYYASEFKPDTTALIFLIISVYCLIDKEKHEKENKEFFLNFDFKRIILVSFFLFLSCSSKQQFILPSLTISIYICFLSKSLLNLLITFLGILLSVLLPSLFLKGYFKMIFLSHMGRGLIDTKSIYYFTLENIQHVFVYIFVLSLLLFFVNISFKYLIGNNFINNRLNMSLKNFEFNEISISIKEFYLNIKSGSLHTYLIILFLPLFFSQFLSTYNLGGNSGNFQMGILPLLVIIFPSFIRINFPLIDKDSDRAIPRVFYLSLMILIFFSVFLSRSIIPFQSDNNYLSAENSVLSEFKGLYDKNQIILVDGNSTLFAREAGYINQISLSHMSHIGYGKLKQLNFDNPIFLSNEGKNVPYLVKGSLVGFIKDTSSKLPWLKDLVIHDEKCLKNICTGIIKVK